VTAVLSISTSFDQTNYPKTFKKCSRYNICYLVWKLQSSHLLVSFLTNF